MHDCRWRIILSLSFLFFLDICLRASKVQVWEFDIAKIIHVFRTLYYCFHAWFWPNSYVNSAKLVYFAVSGNFGQELQKVWKNVKKKTFVKKSKNRINLPSKLEDLLSKTCSLAPKKGLVSDKEWNQIKIWIALSDRSRAVKNTSRSRELFCRFLL